MRLEKIVIPANAKIVKNDFYDYDPEIEFSEENNDRYLYEDLLQIEFEKYGIIIDLGWYNGIFKLYVIQNRDWENPIKTVASKSQRKIKAELNQTIKEVSVACT